MAAMQSLVAAASRKWPDGIPEVVLSFGARDSAFFAQWLQIEISKKKGFTNKSVQCYLDTFAGQRDAKTTLTIMPFIKDNNQGVTRGNSITGWNQGGMAGQLLRGRRVAQPVPSNAVGGAVASLNPAWDENYNLAVNVCNTMIFVLTPTWLSSSNCLGELNQFLAAVEARKNSKQPLNGIAITFPNEFPSAYAKFLGTGATQQFGQNVTKVQEFPTSRVSSIPSKTVAQCQADVPGPQGQLYTIPTVDLSRLVAMIP